MSIELLNKVTALEARVAALEELLRQLAESSKERKTLTLPKKANG